MARPTGKGSTPRRSIRVPDEKWDAATAIAARKGTNLSAVLNRYLDGYIARDDRERAQQRGGAR